MLQHLRYRRNNIRSKEKIWEKTLKICLLYKERVQKESRADIEGHARVHHFLINLTKNRREKRERECERKENIYIDFPLRKTTDTLHATPFVNRNPIENSFSS